MDLHSLHHENFSIVQLFEIILWIGIINHIIWTYLEGLIKNKRKLKALQKNRPKRSLGSSNWWSNQDLCHVCRGPREEQQIFGAKTQQQRQGQEIGHQLLGQCTGPRSKVFCKVSAWVHPRTVADKKHSSNGHFLMNAAAWVLKTKSYFHSSTYIYITTATLNLHDFIVLHPMAKILVSKNV